MALHFVMPAEAGIQGLRSLDCCREAIGGAVRIKSVPGAFPPARE